MRSSGGDQFPAAFPSDCLAHAVRLKGEKKKRKKAIEKKGEGRRRRKKGEKKG